MLPLGLDGRRGKSFSSQLTIDNSPKEREILGIARQECLTVSGQDVIYSLAPQGTANGEALPINSFLLSFSLINHLVKGACRVVTPFFLLLVLPWLENTARVRLSRMVNTQGLVNSRCLTLWNINEAMRIRGSFKNMSTIKIIIENIKNMSTPNMALQDVRILYCRFEGHQFYNKWNDRF